MQTGYHGQRETDSWEPGPWEALLGGFTHCLSRRSPTLASQHSRISQQRVLRDYSIVLASLNVLLLVKKMEAWRNAITRPRSLHEIDLLKLGKYGSFMVYV